MQCNFEIDVFEVKEGDIMFPPSVSFLLVQLNPTPQCMNEVEIDYQINQLLRNVHDLRKKAKKKLKDAINRHNGLLEKKRQVRLV